MKLERIYRPPVAVPPHLSAASLTETWLGGLVIVVAALPLLWPPLGWLLVPIFLAVLIMRAAALLRWRDELDPEPAAWPLVTVLVPVYREAAVLPQLSAAMRAIDYPQLEVVLLVEADDDETEAVLDAWDFDVLILPDGRPRTKPRALCIGLEYTRGEVVTVFDAEDRPAPDQVRRAVARLLSDRRLAVVQAALHCDHDGPMVTRCWDLEYWVLFRGVLPMLSRLGLPFLLGGTSNYFRRDVLEAVGGWDPYNVTEDCDLAVRLARAGWKSSVIQSSTGEEAPVTVSDWMHQRIRWIKGFIATTLVHGVLPKSPHLRLRDRLAIALQMPGQVLVVAAHPVGVYTVASDPTSPQALAFSLGYLIMLVTFWVAARRAGRSWGDAMRMPAYLLLHGMAVLIAVVELVVSPFKWRLSRHGVVKRP